jgi:hypothetical protein
VNQQQARVKTMVKRLLQFISADIQGCARLNFVMGEQIVFQPLKLGLLIGLAFAGTSACGAPDREVQLANPGQELPATAAGGGVHSNDIPINQRFRNLDEYLAFLEQTQATVDGPWYRQVRPGIYELQTGGNLHEDEPRVAAQPTFTREELERKFGFRK